MGIPCQHGGSSSLGRIGGQPSSVDTIYRAATPVQASARDEEFSAGRGAATLGAGWMGVIAAELISATSGLEHPGTVQDSHIVNQDVAEQAEALRGGLVDAVATWDPTYEQIVPQKIGKVLWLAPQGAGAGLQPCRGRGCSTTVKRAGLDGVQLTFFDFAPDRAFFGDHALPLMKHAGLRLGA